MKRAIESARRRTESELGNFKNAIKFRDKLRKNESRKEDPKASGPQAERLQEHAGDEIGQQGRATQRDGRIQTAWFEEEEWLI